MKKIFLAVAASALLAIASIHTANAQSVSTNDVKLSLAFAEPASLHNTGTATTSASINMRALKDFQKSFKNADASWYLTEDGGFVASFTEDNISNSVGYDKKGNWLYNIKRYDESKLSKDVRTEVKSTYYDFNITHVEEVQVNEQTIYIVHLEDAKNMKTLRICDGDMEEVQNFVKG